MTFQPPVLLLPCHSLDDFPVHHEGNEAAGLLAGWTALWHPALLAAAGALPEWQRADDPPESVAGRLVVVPAVSRGDLPAGWIERAEGEAARVVCDATDRDELIAAARATLDDDRPIDAELAADFLALGFCFLQVELLTRQMRYMSHIDEAYFAEQAVEAARAARDDREPESRTHLARCFDVLAQSRDQFYPVDAYLIDLTLVASTTLGASLGEELRRSDAGNLLVSAELVERMAEEEPESLSALRTRLEQGTLTIVGGEYREEELPLLPPEAILAEFTRGAAAWRRHLGESPRVYGRRRFGLTSLLPGLLDNLGFEGSYHCTLDAGQFPQGEQAKTRWEGFDGRGIAALTRVARDAALPETFLAYSHRMGDAMDLDHVATLCFAHWPGQASCWYEDFRRAAAFGPALGRFVTLQAYFDTTDTTDHTSRFEPDEYRSPYLAQSVAAGESDPLSRHVRRHREQAAANDGAALQTIAAVVTGRPLDDADSRETAATVARALATSPAGDRPNGRSESAQRPPADVEGRLLLNPASHTRRIGVELPAPVLVSSGPVRAAGRQGDRQHLLVEVPPMGFAWLSGDAEPPVDAAPPVPMVVEQTLRNEHFEVTVSPESGAIQGLHRYDRRGNQLSQQLAFRYPATARRERGESYTRMTAESVEVTADSGVFGQITSRGNLVDPGGEPLATFEQRVSLWRGSRVLQLDVQLDPIAQPGDDPWDSYFAARFAWSDGGADLWRNVGGAIHPTIARRIEAPLLVDVRQHAGRIALLCGGLPYHRRRDDRMLDTLLVVRGETSRRFRMGIGVGLTHPLEAARDLLRDDRSPPIDAPRPAAGETGWLFHLDSRGVAASGWEPLLDGDTVRGVRVRLMETEGRACQATLRCCRDATAARATDFRGESRAELPVEGDRVALSLAPYEWTQIEIEF